MSAREPPSRPRREASTVVSRSSQRSTATSTRAFRRPAKPAAARAWAPCSPDSERGTQARAAAGFAGRLQARVDVPVDLWDERLTTVEASRRGREGGSRADIDSLAACVLLEAYLAARP